MGHLLRFLGRAATRARAPVGEATAANTPTMAFVTTAVPGPSTAPAKWGRTVLTAANASISRHRLHRLHHPPPPPLRVGSVGFLVFLVFISPWRRGLAKSFFGDVQKSARA